MDAATPQARQDILLNTYFQLIGFSVLYYDYLLTITTEISLIWTRPKYASSLWFFANRYIALVGNTLGLWSAFHPMPVHSCEAWALFRQLLLLVNQVIICILLILRTYALYNRDKRTLALMLGVGFTLLGIACWAFIGQNSQTASDSQGCHAGLGHITAIRLASAWESLFVFDSMILALTVRKTWMARLRPGDDFYGPSLSIMTLVLRDGSIYYIAMAFANLSNILTFYIGGPYLRGGLSIFASGVSVSGMARLMLNLHISAERSRSRSVTRSGRIATTGPEIEFRGVFTSHIASAAHPTQFGNTTFDGYLYDEDYFSNDGFDGDGSRGSAGHVELRDVSRVSSWATSPSPRGGTTPINGIRETLDGQRGPASPWTTSPMPSRDVPEIMVSPASGETEMLWTSPMPPLRDS